MGLKLLLNPYPRCLKKNLFNFLSLCSFNSGIEKELQFIYNRQNFGILQKTKTKRRRLAFCVSTFEYVFFNRVASNNTLHSLRTDVANSRYSRFVFVCLLKQSELSSMLPTRYRKVYLL